MSIAPDRWTWRNDVLVSNRVRIGFKRSSTGFPKAKPSINHGIVVGTEMELAYASNLELVQYIHLLADRSGQDASISNNINTCLEENS